MEEFASVECIVMITIVQSMIFKRTFSAYPNSRVTVEGRILLNEKDMGNGVVAYICIYYDRMQ